MGSLFGGPKPPPLPPPPKPEPVVDPEAAGISEQEKLRKKNATRKGRASTILTGSAGVSDGASGSTPILGG